MFRLKTCSHTRAQQSSVYLEAAFELLGHEEEDYGIDAGVDGGHVDADVVEDQQEAAK